MTEDISGKQKITETKNNIGEQDQSMSKSARKRLYTLKVKIAHNIPPQHSGNCQLISRPLTGFDRMLFLQHSSLKKGAFSPDEDRIIKNNWRTFCEVHDWDPKIVKPFICMRHGDKYYIKGKEERRKFVQYLANGLHTRPLNSVFGRFKILFGEPKQRFKRYTSIEDETILSYMKENSNRGGNNHFSKLAEILGRERHSVWRRYHKLKNMENIKTKKPLSEVEWTFQLTVKFVQTLMDVMLCEKIEKLKDAVVPKSIWIKLENKLNINFKTLKSFWINQLHMELFCPESIDVHDIEIKLIKHIYEEKISSTKKIVWNNVAKHFDGFTPVFLCTLFECLERKVSEKINSTKFSDIIEYMYYHEVLDLQNSLNDTFVLRLSDDSQNATITDEDINDKI